MKRTTFTVITVLLLSACTKLMPTGPSSASAEVPGQQAQLTGNLHRQAHATMVGWQSRFEKARKEMDRG